MRLTSTACKKNGNLKNKIKKKKNNYNANENKARSQCNKTSKSERKQGIDESRQCNNREIREINEL